MSRNFLLIWARNVKKNKLHYFLSLGGMTIGISCCLLMMLFIRYELSFDRHNTNSASLYRVVYGENDLAGSALTSSVLGNALAYNYPDVGVTRFNNAGNARVNFRVDDVKFMESSFFFTDPNVFSTFTLPLAEGNPAEALTKPFTVVISREVARKFFGSEDVLGKSISMEWGTTWYDLKITGLFKPLPETAHFTCHYLISMATAERIFEPKSFFTDWTANFCYNYVWLPPSLTPNVLEQGLNDLYKKNSDQKLAENLKLRLQPLTRIHLYSRLGGELNKNADIRFIYLAVCVGLLVASICIINYVNILHALYTKRIKEVGVKKVLGAMPVQLITQFLGESIVGAGLALLLGLTLTILLTPAFSILIGLPLKASVLLQPLYVCLIIIFTCLTGLLAGLYPVMTIIRFGPGEVLYGKTKQLLKGYTIKKILAGAQVGIALVLITGSLVLHKQLTFIQEKKLGFDKDLLLYTPQGRLIREQAEFMKEELLKTGVSLSITLSSHIPSGSMGFKVPVLPEGGNPDGTNNPWPIAVMSVDFDFASTFGLSVNEGRFFSRDYSSDSTQAFVINEAAAAALGWKNPLGKTIEMTFNVGDGTTETRKGQVIGVLKNFHFESLHKPIEPLVLMCKPFWYYYISFRLPSQINQAQIETLAAAWQKLNPESSFEYTFLSERLNKIYTSENSWSQGIIIFSLIAIIISCIGVFALISFLIQSKLKEFSIRKVLGATPESIARSMLMDLTKIVIVAALAAYALAYWGIQSWLQNFAYKTEVGPVVYIKSFFIVLSLTIINVLTQIIKASKTNPVAYLKTE